MVIARRSVSVFLGVWGVSTLFFGCASPIVMHRLLFTQLPIPSFTPHSSCVTRQPTLETWGLAGLVVLVAAVLWLAPWRRFTGERTRGRRLMPFRLKRRLIRVGGWALIALGLGVMIVSVWGVLLPSGRSSCLLEIGCYDPPRSGLALRPPVREPLVSLVRFVGVGFGLASVVWGSLVAGLNQRQFGRELVQAVAVLLVVMVILAPGYPGVGTFQTIALLTAALVALLLFWVRDAIAAALLKPLLSPYAAPVAMAATVLSGAWLAVLATVSPVGCQGPVRCAQELRPAMLLASAFVAAGLYVVYARLSATRPPRAAREMVRSGSD